MEPTHVFAPETTGAPSLEELKSLAEKLGLPLTDAEAEGMMPLLPGLAKSYEVCSKLTKEGVGALPSDWKREGRQVDAAAPKEEENAHMAWAWRCKIRERAEGGKLEGLTLAVKDNVAVGGVPLRNGSRVLEGFVPASDAKIVRLCLDEGVTVVGKTNNEDLCLSGGSWSNSTGAVKNPWDKSSQAGGSSSGSGVVVATGEADLAIACDQGGSIRIPSCWCGVVGLKPTHGRCSYDGIFSMEKTVDHVGPVAKTVALAKTLFSVLEAENTQDARRAQFPAAPAKKDGPVRIGILKEGFLGVDAAVDTVAKAAAAALKAKGFVVKEVSVPLHSEGPHIWMPVGVEGIWNTQFVHGGQGVSDRGVFHTDMMAATQAGLKEQEKSASLSVTNKLFMLYAQHVRKGCAGAWYGMGQNLARALTEAYDKCMEEEVDFLLMPTLPLRPTAIPEKEAGAADRWAASLNMIANTCPFNASGHPACTVNAGFCENLPIGVQLVGRHNDDYALLEVAEALESAREAGAIAANITEDLGYATTGKLA